MQFQIFLMFALLRSNEAPLESELSDIKTSSSDMDSRLAFLDDEIARLRARVEQLEEERIVIRTRREHNRAILSPLRRMPPEVLAEVFLWSLPPRYVDYKRGGYDVKESPWVLTHVCSRWRAVALSTSSLWSCIVITYFPENVSFSAYPLPLVKAHIQRSGSQQLVVSFEGCETSDWEPQVEVFRCLAQHCGRWVELDMRLTSPLLPLLISLRDQVPCLRKIWLEWYNLEIQAGVQTINCFETARALVDVGISTLPPYIPIPLPVHQLTRYSMNAPWHVHQSILKLAPNLVEARICVATDERWSESQPSPITLPFLRRLYASDTEILDYTTVPTLEEIAFCVDGDDLDLQRRLASLLDRSSCPLRRLCLAGRPTASGTLSILKTLSCIVELVILNTDKESDNDDETSDDEDETLDDVNTLMLMLTVSGVAGCATVAPQLRCMFFGYDGKPSLSCAFYLEMIRSRWRAAHCRIESAALVVPEAPPPKALDALFALRRDGLDLFVVWGDDPAAGDVVDRWLYNT
ncbi:hypothetical protein GGX14DRAFT_582744 [Mycena pura]|uniref:F-box domain-containing protein n=1 Tax=Mycena pura TaxID=153505 RepID=A0AAD7E6E7_9AGAR|nr:hypothetical protein GGX14DRAFT_582744 [Mycena pura]